MREGLRRLFEASGLSRNGDGAYEHASASAPRLVATLDAPLRAIAVEALRGAAAAGGGAAPAGPARRAPEPAGAAAAAAAGAAAGGGEAAAAVARRTFGPAVVPPPAVLAAAAAAAAAAPPVSDDDDVGPLPADHPGARRGMSNAELRALRAAEADTGDKSGREEWMTALPADRVGIMGMAGLTEQKNRSFSQCVARACVCVWGGGG